MRQGRGGRESARKIVVGVTGASGAPYAKRLISILVERAESEGDVEVACVFSDTAHQVMELECGCSASALGAKIYPPASYDAPFASGSAGWHAMVVVPCSMGTAGRIAHGLSDSLLTRAADVMLKERRTLVVVPREAPMSVIHLENLVTLARAGAIVVPASPSFYGKPQNLDQAIDTVVARVLDHIGVENGLGHRWGARGPELGAAPASASASRRPALVRVRKERP